MRTKAWLRAAMTLVAAAAHPEVLSDVPAGEGLSRIREAIATTYAKRYEHRTQAPPVPEEAR